MTSKTLSAKNLSLHALGALVALATAASGCVVNNPPAPPLDGSITFAWSFAGEQDCDLAGVAEVDVQVLADGGVVFSETVDCFGGGLTLTDFSPDAYEILLDAFSRSGRLLFQGEGFVQVQEGVENDIGVIDLRRVGEQQQPAPRGSLAFFWGFLYPTDDSLVIDCGVAGVDGVLVDIQSNDGAVSFVDTFDCEDEGVVLDNLPAGGYSVLLEAFGRYQNDDILLYDGLFDVTVTGNATNELGDLPLARVFESFADIEVSWDVAGGTCAQLDVPEVTVLITRIGSEQPDDTVTVECDRTFALRETFVPGSYLIEVLAAGDGGDYYGSVTRDVAPNITAETHVELVLAP